MDIFGAVRFIVVLNNNFTTGNRLRRSGTDAIIAMLIVVFTIADVGQNLLFVGHRHRIGFDLPPDNVTDVAK